MAAPAIDADDRVALAELLRDTIAADRFPLSPRIRRLKTILVKLEPLRPAVMPRPSAVPSMALAKKRRR